MTGNKSQRRPRLSEQINSAKWASVIALGAGWLILVGTPSCLAQTNYYVNSLWGSNSYDGLQPVPVGQSGPKQQVSAAIATAASGDSIEIAQGLYQDTTWSPGSKNLALRPMGLVKLVDYDPRSADSDNDGMNDAWEAYYGFDPYTAQSGDYAPGADPDQDGFTNAQESELRTNPNIPNVHTPTIVPPPEQGNAGYGLFEGPVSVTLTTDTAGATIRYTLDGSDPTANATVYLGPFELSGTNDSTFFTVTARAFKAGCDPSDAASVWYLVIPVPSAQFVATATTIQGNWKGVYGVDGYNLAGDAAAYPDYVHSTFSYLPGPCLWASATNDWRALLRASDTNNIDRVAAGWCRDIGEYFDLNFTDGQAHQVALYFLDWERLGRSLDVYLQDYYAGPVLNLDHQTVTNFADGQYLAWNLRGHVSVIVVPSDIGSYDGVLSGLFFQPTNPPPAVVMPFIDPNGGTFVDGVIVGLSNVTAGATVHYTLDGSDPTANSASYSEALFLTNTTTVKARGYLGAGTNSWVSRADFVIVLPATAEFVGMDWLTQGSWDGWYGTDGYHVIGGTASYPSYAQLTTNGTSTVTWSASTNDVRALQAAAGTTNRVAAAWYSDFSFDLALNLPYGQTNLVALYFLDWQRLGLEQGVDIFDAVSGGWLDSQEVSDFAGGQYLVWELSGPVTVQVTSLNTNFGPVVSGVFFDPLQAPAIPADLAVTFYSTNEVSLAWTNTDGSVQGFRIERSSDGGQTYQVIASLLSNLMSYADVAVDPGMTYAYEIVAFDTLGGNSAPAMLTPPTVTATIRPAPNDAGWNNTNVVVQFASADGFLAADYTTVDTETNDLEVTGVATNAAGLPAYASVVVNIDKTPPAIAMDPADNQSFDNSYPLLIVQYSDAMSGLNLDSLQITLDSVDVTTNFYRLDNGAIASMANLAAGSHTWTVRIGDQADNTNTVTATFTATGAINTNAPVLFGFDMDDVIEMPDVSEVWLQGEADNTNATLAAWVNLGVDQPLSSEEGIFGGLVPLEKGTNVVVVVATDPQQHLSSKLLVVIRGDHYWAGLTEPAFGVFANGETQRVTVAVSPKLDEGLATEEDLTRVVIDDVDADFVGGDGNGNWLFRVFEPAPCRVWPIVVRLHWSNGSLDKVPLGMIEGYEIVSRFSSSAGFPIVSGQGPGQSQPDCWDQQVLAQGEQATESFLSLCVSPTVWNEVVTNDETFVQASRCVDPCKLVFDENDSWTPTSSTVASNCVLQPAQRGLSLGYWSAAERCLPPSGPEPVPGRAQSLQADGSITFRAPFHYKNTPVVFTVAGLFYVAPPGQMNLTNVLLWGHRPWAVGANWAQYRIEMSGDRVYLIDTNALTWPETSPQTTPYGAWYNLSCGDPANYVAGVNAHWLTFTSFRNRPDVTLVFDERSRTVAGGNPGKSLLSNLQKMGRNRSSELRINANFDQGHRKNDHPLEDFRGDSLPVGSDPDLLAGSFNIEDVSGTGHWQLTYDTNVVVWTSVGGSWQRVQQATDYAVTTPAQIALLVEGVKGSTAPNDVHLAARFTSGCGDYTLVDTAAVTVVETQFMLTFDDGPYAENDRTQKILDGLATNYVDGVSVRAAFFMVGQFVDATWPDPDKEGTLANPTLVRNVALAGHVVGNHTLDHANLSGRTEAEVRSKVSGCDDILRDALSAPPPKFFRSPALRAFNEAGANGYTIVWGKTFMDWMWLMTPTIGSLKPRVSQYLNEWNTKAQPRRKQGYPVIVILHESSDVIADHLGELVTDLRNRGYVLVSVETDTRRFRSTYKNDKFFYSWGHGTGEGSE